MSAASRTEMVVRLRSGCPNLPLLGVVQPPVIVTGVCSHDMR